MVQLKLYINNVEIYSSTLLNIQLLKILKYNNYLDLVINYFDKIKLEIINDEHIDTYFFPLDKLYEVITIDIKTIYSTYIETKDYIIFLDIVKYWTCTFIKSLFIYNKSNLEET